MIKLIFKSIIDWVNGEHYLGVWKEDGHLYIDRNGLIFLSRQQFMMTKRVLRSRQEKHYLMNWKEKVLLHVRNVLNEGVIDISRKKVNWSEKDGKEQKFVLLMRYVVLPGCSIKGQQTTIEPDFINGNNFYLLFVLALLLGDDISFWRFARWGRRVKASRGSLIFALHFYKVIIKAIWRDQYVESHLGQT